MNKPLYIRMDKYNVMFHFPDGSEKELTTKYKQMKALPEGIFKLSRFSMWGLIRELGYSLSQVAGFIDDVEFVDDIIEPICFFDTETENNGFVLGIILDDKESRVIRDEKQFLDELVKYKTVIGFNIFRYDFMQILGRDYPEYFEIFETKKKYRTFTLKNQLVIDLNFFAKLIKDYEELESASLQNIARALGYKKKFVSLDNKEEKCKQDCELLGFVYERLHVRETFNVIQKLANLDTIQMQSVFSDRLRKWILLYSYMKNGYLPIKFPKHNDLRDDEIPKPIKIAERGFYKDVVYVDVEQAYPSIAKEMELKIYPEEAKPIYSLLESKLVHLAQEHPNSKYFLKYIANALTGDMRDKNNYMRNEKIYHAIVSKLSEMMHSRVEELKRKKIKVYYSNTDCFVVDKKADAKLLEIDGLAIKPKHNFKWLFVRDPNCWIGYDNITKSIAKKGFPSIDMSKPQILALVRDEIFKKLEKAKANEVKKLLRNPKRMVDKVLKNIRKYDREYFKILINKNTEVAERPEYVLIWNELKDGLNDAYIKGINDGLVEYTVEPKRIGYKHYKDMILEYVERFRL